MGREKGRVLPRKEKRRERREGGGGEGAGEWWEREDRACSEATGESLEWDASGTGVRKRGERGGFRWSSPRVRGTEEDPQGKGVRESRAGVGEEGQGEERD